ncbi:MAG: hypothetical protein HYX69_18220 [Planctomycetia bacterium]|nr:hypothetical protein [Planctomycetia bacterium]
MRRATLVWTTRRFPWTEAEASEIGGLGGISPAASAAAGAPPPLPPQQPLPQLSQLLQQLLQLLQHDFLQRNRPSRPPQQRFLQQLLQHEACSQQVGSQHEACSQQVGSQHEGSQQLFLQQPPQSNRPRRPPNKPPQQRLWQQPPPQLLQLSQHEACSQQVGSQLACSQQVGSQQACSQQLGSQQLLQQLLQPPQPPCELKPNIRSRSSKPKLWLHRPTLTTSAPKNMFHFIDQRLLCNELRAAAHADCRTPRAHRVLQSEVDRSSP